MQTANDPAVAKSAIVLQAMGCIRIEAGIRSRLLNGVSSDQPWQVRFYPAGISSGVVLWAMPSAFTAMDGSKPAPVTTVGY